MIKRCLYCGIRLRIQSEAMAIGHCPACSVGLEMDEARRMPAGRAARDERLLNRAEKELPAQRRSTALVLLNH